MPRSGSVFSFDSDFGILKDFCRIGSVLMTCWKSVTSVVDSCSRNTAAVKPRENRCNGDKIYLMQVCDQ